MSLEEFLLVHSGQELVLDVETDSADRLLGIGFGWGPDIEQTVYFHRPDLVRILEAGTYVTHYGLSDALVLLREGLQIRIAYDTYSAARCILYTQHEGFSLTELEQVYFAVLRPTAGDMILKYGSMEAAPEAEVEEHCRADCAATWRLMTMFRSMRPEMAAIIQTESHLNHVLAHMKFHGFGFDAGTMTAIILQLDADMTALRKEIATYITASPSNNDALARALFTPLPVGLGIDTTGLPVTRTRKRVSINAEMLAQISDRHPVLGLIAIWKKLEKMRSTYTTSYVRAARKDGRIHCNLNSFGSSTTRVIASNPNMQNIPVRGHGYILRRAYVASPGCVLFDMDYSQIEINILAVMSGDQELQRIIREGRDVHRITAEEVLYERPVTKPERDEAKPVNFGMVYGGGVWLFRRWPDPNTRMARWHKRYPGVKPYQDKYWRPEMQERGYNLSYFKRRRQLYKLPSHADPKKRAGLYRVLINGDIQMTGSDILKLGMDACFDVLATANRIAALKGDPWAALMVMCVHDSITFDVRKEYLDALAPKLIKAMTGISWPLPLKVEAKVGPNWHDMVPFS